MITQIENKKLKTNNLEPETDADKKILEALAKTKGGIAADIEQFEFSHALHTLYDFFWHEFCDIYIEAAKEQIAEGTFAESTHAILSHVLTDSLKMLHPFLPFVTEAAWKRMDEKSLLMVEPW